MSELVAAFPLELGPTQWYRLDPRQLDEWMQRPDSSPAEVMSLVEGLAGSTEALELCAWSGTSAVRGTLFHREDAFVAMTSAGPSYVLISGPVPRSSVTAALRAQVAPGDGHLAMPAGSMAALAVLARHAGGFEQSAYTAMVGGSLFDQLLAGGLITLTADTVGFGPMAEGWMSAFEGRALQLRRRHAGPDGGTVIADFVLMGPAGDRVLALPDIGEDGRVWLMRLGEDAAMAALTGLVVPTVVDDDI